MTEGPKTCWVLFLLPDIKQKSTSFGFLGHVILIHAIYWFMLFRKNFRVFNCSSTHKIVICPSSALGKAWLFQGMSQVRSTRDIPRKSQAFPRGDGRHTILHYPGRAVYFPGLSTFHNVREGLPNTHTHAFLLDARQTARMGVSSRTVCSGSWLALACPKVRTHLER